MITQKEQQSKAGPWKKNKRLRERGKARMKRRLHSSSKREVALSMILKTILQSWSKNSSD